MNLQHDATPVAFLYAGDRQRALDFYRDVLDAPVVSSDPFGDFLDLGGARLRMTVMADYKPGSHPVLGWNVGDVAVAVATLRARGVAFTIYEGMGQDADGIWTGPGGARVAWFQDSEGNVLSLSQA